MILDKKLELANGANAFATNNTVLSTNGINTGNNGANSIGAGHKIMAKVTVHTNFATGTSVQGVIQDSADAANYATILAGPVVATANAIVGKVLLSAAVPSTHRQYVKTACVNIGAMDAGKVNAYLHITPE